MALVAVRMTTGGGYQRYFRAYIFYRSGVSSKLSAPYDPVDWTTGTVYLYN